MKAKKKKSFRKDKAPHFDMYHFFSRKDVILLGLLLFVLLLLVLWSHFGITIPA